MVIVQIAIFSIAFQFIFAQNKQILVPISSIIVSLVYYVYKYCTSVVPSISKLFSGQLIHQVTYLSWQYFYPKDYLLYYLPLILSNAGNDAESQSKIEQIIFLQNKTELYILFTLVIGFVFNISVSHFVQIFIFALYCKIKYSFYFPFQKTMVDVHFFFQKQAKLFGLFFIYHPVYSFINLFSNTYSSSRDIAY